jgi:hypothetical protein
MSHIIHRFGWALLTECGLVGLHVKRYFANIEHVDAVDNQLELLIGESFEVLLM